MHESRKSGQGETGVAERTRRVRIPLFPIYDEVRHLVKVWPGRPKAQVTGLHSALRQLLGTPQNPVAWTDPDTWIPAKLTGDTRDLAAAIWTESSQNVNPEAHLWALAPSPEIQTLRDSIGWHLGSLGPRS